VDILLKQLETQQKTSSSQWALLRVIAGSCKFNFNLRKVTFVDPTGVLPVSASDRLHSRFKSLLITRDIIEGYMKTLDSDLFFIISFIISYSSPSILPLAHTLVSTRSALQEFVGDWIKVLTDDVKKFNKFYEEVSTLVNVVSSRPTIDHEYVESVFEELREKYPEREDLVDTQFCIEYKPSILNRIPDWGKIPDDFGGLSPVRCATATISPPSPTIGMSPSEEHLGQGEPQAEASLTQDVEVRFIFCCFFF